MTRSTKSIYFAFVAWASAAVLLAACSRAPYDGPLFPAPVNGVWGYIDNRGNMQIPPQWQNVLPFSEGLAGIMREGRWGFINRKGEEVIPPRFRSVQSFHEGKAVVQTGLADQPTGVIDTSGVLTLGKPVANEVPNQPEPLTIQLKPESDEFREGLKPIQKEGHWMYVNRSGEITADFPAGIAFAEPLSEGLSLVTADRDEGGRGFGYVDRQGRWAVKPVWDEAEPFQNGLARVGRWKDNKVVYINPSGDVVWREP